MNPEMLLIPAFVMLAPVAILLIFMRYRTQQTLERYRTLLQLADKGVDLPEQMLFEPHAAHADRRRGIVLLAGGLGVMAMFAALPFELESGRSVASLWGLGLLPLVTGLGYLASWYLECQGDPAG